MNGSKYTSNKHHLLLDMIIKKHEVIHFPFYFGYIVLNVPIRWKKMILHFSLLLWLFEGDEIFDNQVNVAGF